MVFCYTFPAKGTSLVFIVNSFINWYNIATLFAWHVVLYETILVTIIFAVKLCFELRKFFSTANADIIF